MAESRVERLPDLLAELVRLKVDVIVTGGIINRAAKEATATIPIVIAFDFDPVANGLVASLARPGGNITGLSARYPELSGKQLELLKEIVPRLSRVAVLGSSTEPGNTHVVREVEAAAEALGVQYLYLDLQDAKDIETAFRAASKRRANALLVLGGHYTPFSPNPDYNTCDKEPAPSDVPKAGICGRRRAYDLWPEHCRPVPARHYLCR